MTAAPDLQPTHVHDWQRNSAIATNFYACATCGQLGLLKTSGRIFKFKTAEQRAEALHRRIVAAFCRACHQPATARAYYQGAAEQPVCASCKTAITEARNASVR